ncbi:MAG: hypothetical protein EBU46_05740 [Nitrosomonadaceae bacterium]|nr:hypothetical protein [Nitrosomonadaceae bacterium]
MDGQLLAETTDAGSLIRVYFWAEDMPIAQMDTELTYLHADHLDTPRIGTNSSGAIVWQWNSDAFGSQPPNEDPDGNGMPTTVNLRFPGQYFDKETNLHYNYFRDYDPRIGRYLGSDPIGLMGGINTYLYAGANPLMYTDPLGLFSAADLPSIPQPVVNFSVGLGDALLLGTGGYLRDWAVVDGGVNPCSDAYDYGAVAVLAAGGRVCPMPGWLKRDRYSLCQVRRPVHLDWD